MLFVLFYLYLVSLVFQNAGDSPPTCFTDKKMQKLSAFPTCLNNTASQPTGHSTHDILLSSIHQVLSRTFYGSLNFLTSGLISFIVLKDLRVVELLLV
jgi:hypothetical protein